ncbi:MAG: LysR family transcriptional regulator [Erysipelotrichaceae bacterium]|nr:LysR family transcriptional regulator [Erysipelotrichaceae bacterium]
MISNELIQTFLDVVEYGNLTKAAAHTFSTQSSISKQLNLLEEEVGTKLILRQKGHSEITLTAAGHDFFNKAKEWQILMKDFDNIHQSVIKTEISIGALDRFNYFTLKNFYKYMMQKYPNIQLDTHSYHSKEIYSMMENRRYDIGIVSASFPTFNIKVTPLLDEVMFVICNKNNDLGKIVSPEDLDPEKEIYSRWSDEFEIWHDQLWPGRKYPLHVGTSAMTPNYLDEPGRWSIVPVSVLNAFQTTYDYISIHHLTIEAPIRRTYLLEQKKPKHNKIEALEIFKKELIDYLKKDPYFDVKAI